jgi:hypothetical protein
MRNSSNFLFSGNSVFDVQRAISEMALKEVDGYEENIVLSTPTDDLIQSLKAKYAFHFPEIRETDTYIEEKEIKREQQSMDYDFYNDSRAGYRTVTQNFVIFHVPFSGDASLFSVAPSHRSMPGPAADISNSELLITVATDGQSQEQIKSHFTSHISEIKKHVDQMKRDLANIHFHFENAARQKIDERKSKLLKSKNLVASLGFPMKRRENAPTTYIAPQVRRKVVPVRPATRPPFKPEPTLEEAEYQHILNVMDNMTTVIERSPHLFIKMGEEDIRQHFLVQLNAQYEGQATGETFNAAGKTDILIRSEGQNIFIAECKFWHGEKGFLETVDQLLSYVTWRDTKTALVIFNRNKNLSAVIATIKSAMEKHEHKKQGPKVEGDTRIRYVMGHPSDHSREIITTVMVYDIPVLD